MGAEMHPTRLCEAGMEAEYISEVARAHGMPLEAPVVIVTDFLIKVVHLPDIEMTLRCQSTYLDFLTKWVSKKKVDASVYYLTHAANRVKHPSEPRS